MHKPKNIAVVGSCGYIATSLCQQMEKQGHTVIKIDKVQEEDVIFLDLQDTASFDYRILANIDYVIFTAAISSPDICEKQRAFCEEINVTGTCNFIRSAMKLGCKVIFFSSDAVFGYGNGTVLDESILPHPISEYGKMKYATEQCFSNSSQFKAIRLSYVFSKHDKFTQYLMKCQENHETAEIFHPFYRNVICLNELVEIISNIMEEWSGLNTSIVNICGRELISRVRIADTLNRICNLQIKYTLIDMGCEMQKIRPQATHMCTMFPQVFPAIITKSFEERVLKEIEKE